MDYGVVTIIATISIVIGILLGRTIKSSPVFDPFTYYRTRVRQIIDGASKQSDIQAELREFDDAFSRVFPDTKK